MIQCAFVTVIIVLILLFRLILVHQFKVNIFLLVDKATFQIFVYIFDLIFIYIVFYFSFISINKYVSNSYNSLIVAISASQTITWQI